MNGEEKAGFFEILHTADLALKVWAPDFPSLLRQAAKGMYSLEGVTLNDEFPIKKCIILEGFDEESLLIGFLNELLYIQAVHKYAFRHEELEIIYPKVEIRMAGAQIAGIKRELKAATFHRLKIDKTKGYEASIVFDV